jgi:hypothetical protein
MKLDNMRTALDIVIVVPGLPFDGNTFDSLSIGGSESAGYYMARALAKRGHHVTVFCNTPARVRCDVDYVPLTLFPSYAGTTQHDVCIVQRAPQFLSTRVQARFTGLWCHDLAAKRSEQDLKGVAWNYDKVFVLSEFMRKQYEDVYSFPDEFMFLTRNGVDLDCVMQVRDSLPADIKRNPLSLVYSARPERGLDVLLTESCPAF